MSSLTVRINPMQLSQLTAFCSIRGRVAQNTKDVYFVEWLGLPQNADEFIETLSKMQKQAQSQNLVLLQLQTLHTRPNPQQTELCTRLVDALLSHTPFTFPSAIDCRSAQRLPNALGEVLAEYQKQQPNASQSMVKNCAVRLICAFLEILPKLFPTGSLSDDQPKCIWIGEPDTTARLFLPILPQIGCDVAVIRPNGTQTLFPQAHTVQGVPTPDFKGIEPPSPSSVLTIPRHPNRPSKTANCPKPVPSAPPSPPPTQTPLDYEALAGFAPSVVMIEVLNEQGKACSSGSGVVIASGGIIVTNFHVVSGGTAYAIHLENSQTTFYTDQLLKYHSNYDLALLRLPDCQVPPIPLYQGNSLARGQQVFAIGSPLGLFNSVSDGIIAGFRTIEYNDMIQFTAPTSHGSSGGALLNRYGQLIGIVTAGYADGQNLNLAVSYQTISQFVRGFLNQ